MNIIKSDVFIGLIEIPDEISLIIPFAGCGHSCKGCHSVEYQSKESGELININEFYNLISEYINKVSCICFFGGEYDPQIFWYLICAKELGFKVALYSGYELKELPDYILDNVDYIKTGEYVEELGGLDSKTTNQILYKINYNTPQRFIDITTKFWRNND